mmetsp:Transcript_44143/g.104472  ORF Transcript_44143/g.104472 Transcript_44143/m.104472 type:complete len:437 (-) Transcript_44143:2-1312(-)
METELFSRPKRFHGTLKRYNDAQGYGFVACPEIHKQFNRDVFIHRHEVYQARLEIGGRLSFEIKLNNNGQPQAEEVIAEEDGAARGDAGQDSRYTGTVKSYDPMQGYGFIACPELHERHGRDTFLHRSEVESSQCSIGDTVTFAAALKNGRPQAQQVAKAGAAASAEGATDPPEAAASEAPEAPRQEPQAICLLWQKGTCSFGSRCKYRHEVDDDNDDAGESAGQSQGQGLGRLRGACPYFLSGNCRQGADCKRRHPDQEEADSIRAELSTVPCRDGIHCRFWNCLYSHNDNEGAEVTGACMKVPQDEETATGVETPLGQTIDSSLTSEETLHDAESGDEVVAKEPAVSGDVSQPLEADWRRYCNATGDHEEFWWWCDATQDWFMESSGKGSAEQMWQCYTDPGTQSSYWWLDDARWFWVSADGESGTWAGAGGET